MRHVHHVHNSGDRVTAARKRKQELHRRHSKRYRDNMGELFQNLEGILPKVIPGCKLKTKSQIISHSVQAIVRLRTEVAALEMQYVLSSAANRTKWVEDTVSHATCFQDIVEPFMRLLLGMQHWKHSELWGRFEAETTTNYMPPSPCPSPCPSPSLSPSRSHSHSSQRQQHSKNIPKHNNSTASTNSTYMKSTSKMKYNPKKSKSKKTSSDNNSAGVLKKSVSTTQITSTSTTMLRPVDKPTNSISDLGALSSRKFFLKLMKTASAHDVTAQDIPESYSKFSKQSQLQTLTAGDDSLIGRITRSLSPEWIDLTDPVSGNSFKRCEVAKQCGFIVCFAVPFLIRGHVFAAVLFFDDQPRSDISPDINIAQDLASSLGNCYGASKMRHEERPCSSPPR